ncbi:MAG: cytochrome c-type biogenesis CcmF C-terminal domain-containing protein, partial [Gammaproteobacteria bacterium]
QAVSFWSLAVSRQALRSGLLPVLFALAAYFYWRAIGVGRGEARLEGRAGWKGLVLDAPRPYDALACALCIGATLWTYIPARVMWIVFPAFLAYLALVHRTAFRRAWLPTLLAVVIGLLLLILALFDYVYQRYRQEKDLRIEQGHSYQLGGYDFLFKGATRTQGPNYSADRGEVVVSHAGKQVTTLYPEKRDYRSGMPMTEAGIDAGLTRDLFVALGEPLGNDGAWSLRIYHKPFVRWIWLGGLFMALGGLLSALDKRYFRLARKARQEAERHAIEGAA